MGGYLCCYQDGGGAEDFERDHDDALDVEELMLEAQGDGAGGNVELSLGCTGLSNQDNSFSRTDPFIVCRMFMRSEEGIPTQEQQMLGKTETIQNCLTPVFLHPIMCSYSRSHAPDQVMLHFEVFHEKQKDLPMDDQSFLGEYTVCLQDLLDMEGKPFVGDLVKQRSQGQAHLGLSVALDKAAVLMAGTLDLAAGAFTLVTTGKKGEVKVPRIQITAEHVHNVQEKVIIELSGRNLSRPRTRFGLKSALANYFVQICRVQGHQMMPVAATRITRHFMTKDTLAKGVNPDWKPLHIKTYRLCNNNFHCPLQFSLYDYNFLDSSKSQLIGQGRTTLAALTSGVTKSIPLLNEERVNTNDGGVGELVIQKVQLLTSYSFLDYVKMGFEINCSMAFDFSTSCKEMHHIHPTDPEEHPNDFAQAIRAVCEVVGRYDKDQMFPSFGFAAMLGDGKSYNNFPISLDLNNVDIQGVDRLVRCYEKCAEMVGPVEPTTLASVLKHTLYSTLENTLENPDQPGYQLQVIFTDGMIDDVTETIDVLVEASKAPMSILIVGMGDGGATSPEDKGFEKIRSLCVPNLRSVISGKSVQREIVSFVVWNDYRGKEPDHFARAALSRIPKHFLSWVDLSGYSMERTKEVDFQRLKRGSTYHNFADLFHVPNDPTDTLLDGNADKASAQGSSDTGVSIVIGDGDGVLNAPKGKLTDPLLEGTQRPQQQPRRLPHATSRASHSSGDSIGHGGGGSVQNSADADPTSLEGRRLETGDILEIVNLSDNPEFNGSLVRAVGVSGGKVVVEFAGKPGAKAALRPECLRHHNILDTPGKSGGAANPRSTTRERQYTPPAPTFNVAPPMPPSAAVRSGDGAAKAPINPYGPAAVRPGGSRAGPARPPSAPPQRQRGPIRTPAPLDTPELRHQRGVPRLGSYMSSGSWVHSAPSEEDAAESAAAPGLELSKVAPGTPVVASGVTDDCHLNGRAGTVVEVVSSGEVVVDFGAGVGMRSLPAVHLLPRRADHGLRGGGGAGPSPPQRRQRVSATVEV